MGRREESIADGIRLFKNFDSFPHPAKIICSHSSIQNTAMIKISKGKRGSRDKEHGASHWLRRAWYLLEDLTFCRITNYNFEELPVSIDNHSISTPFSLISLWIFCKVIHDALVDIYVTKKTVWNVSRLTICSIPNLTWTVN